jgi:biopolymer transport protein ExbD
VHLAIRADGSMRWNGVPINASDWRAELAVASQTREGWTISFEVADGAPYQVVAAALADAKSSGASSINFSDR